MSRAVQNAVKSMFTDIAKSRSAIEKILNPSTDGAGHRGFPAKTSKNDEKYGLRLDKGEPVQGQPNTVAWKLQLNSNAASKTIRDLAKKNPHRVIATAVVDTEQEPTKENLDKLMNELMDDLDV